MADTHQDGTGSGADFDLSQFYQIFFEEASENLDQMEQMLLSLDLSAADDEELNGIFRCAHSIKGGAATFGFSDVTELTHRMESLLDRLRRHEITPIPAMVDVLLESADASRSLLARHQSGDEGEPISTAELVVRICCDELPREGVDVGRDVQVLSPMHRLACGVENLNKLLQASLNPPSRGKLEAAHAGRIFRVGDKVMQTRNDYDKGVFNGDIGRVADMDDEMVLIRYPEGDVPYDRSELDALAPAYAMSVHKSQGSEYPVVVLTLVSGHYVMLQRNLLYTAITRAKQRVILVGSSAALSTAVANDRTRRRHSLLAERLRREALE